MIHIPLSLVPRWAWAAIAGAAALAAASIWFRVQLNDARDEGRAEVQATWDEVERQRGERIRADRERRAREAAAQATEHLATQAALQQSLKEARDAVKAALRRPLQCPAGETIELGDVVLPGAAFDGLRRATRPAGERTE